MMNGGWMYGMGWGWILVVAALGLLSWVVVRAARSSSRSPGSSPETVLKERFARGEIDEEEYRARRKALQDRS